ncbi:MAG: hypothetical protein AAF900_00675 [Bacteroidota bacterium]
METHPKNVHIAITFTSRTAKSKTSACEHTDNGDINAAEVIQQRQYNLY